MRVLVIGGAGYIGSHTVRELRRGGHQVVVMDNLSRGHREAVRDVPLVEGDFGQRDRVLEVLQGQGVEAVMHFGALSLVGESMTNPGPYFANNVAGTIALLEAMREAGVRYLVFSSSAAVYGEAEQVPLTEDLPPAPTSVYGQTKWMCEQILAHYARAYGLRYVSLRYFNAAGADPSGEIGEDHSPETHLVPIAIQAALGLRPEVVVFGRDYPTPDGTCIRDYIHVTDLARAHVLALEYLQRREVSDVFNLGNGAGYSVLQVLEAVGRVSGRPVPYRFGPRRPGDPAVLVASAEKAMRELGWRPQFAALDQIVGTAWAWHSRHPHGFRS